MTVTLIHKKEYFERMRVLSSPRDTGNEVIRRLSQYCFAHHKQLYDAHKDSTFAEPFSLKDFRAVNQILSELNTVIIEKQIPTILNIQDDVEDLSEVACMKHEFNLAGLRHAEVLSEQKMQEVMGDKETVVFFVVTRKTYNHFLSSMKNLEKEEKKAPESRRLLDEA